MKRTSLLLALLLLPLAAHAQLTTDRPTFTAAPTVLAEDAVQIEAGATMERFGDFEIYSLPELLVRWGATPNVEVRVAAPSYFDGDFADGWGEASVGVKWQLGTPRTYAVALVAQLNVPVEQSFALDNIDPSAALVYGRPIGEAFSLGAQLGARYFMAAETARVDGGLVLGWALSPRVGQFTEIVGLGLERGGSAVFVQHGYTFAIAPSWQVDLRGGLGLTDDAIDLVIGAGISHGF